jgi:hypothetical protein
VALGVTSGLARWMVAVARSAIVGGDLHALQGAQRALHSLALVIDTAWLYMQVFLY